MGIWALFLYNGKGDPNAELAARLTTKDGTTA